MTIRIFSGDQAIAGVEGDDRGLAYGDGVFETLLVHRGQPVWWDEHWRRLERGAGVLGIPLPNQSQVRGECDRVIADAARAVLKIILTRGRGGRGYAPPPALPEGVALQWCKTPMAIQPRLAGIKHCNRLEQVLARAECRDPDIFDGLMCDTDGRVVSATSANLFARIDGFWLTPAVQRCGVAGIARDWLLQHLERVGEAELTPADIENAEAVFLCNAVRGILPVRCLGQRRWPRDADVEKIRRQLLQEQPAFSPEEN